MKQHRVRAFVVLFVFLSAIVALVPILGPAFPWTESAESNYQNQQYKGSWSLKSVEVCSPSSSSSAMTNCVSYSYDSNVTIAVPSRTNSSQIIVITDPRVHIPQCKHAGQAIYGITYFLIVVDVLCIISVSTASCCPVVTNTYEDTSVFCFFLKYVRYLSLIGGLLLLGLNLVIWGIACHLQVRSVASNARLSA
eukprot:TRINITY_DN403_c0_g1_i2.p1 TRINITY_DN403_c0_g1~~TRINITY_DN403_c0_g1_i2.p1  ORF type:complete len:225 (-),score=30.73 TRINITY_DN403_c0_g1_i2:267-848(-)